MQNQKTKSIKLATDIKKTKPSQAMSTLMFWNKQNGNSNQNGNENVSSGGKNGKKTWLHSPESLVNGHVAYLVKVSTIQTYIILHRAIKYSVHLYIQFFFCGMVYSKRNSFIYIFIQLNFIFIYFFEFDTINTIFE